MSSEDHWEVLPLDRPFSYKNWAKRQRKWPYYETVFCFCHNFLYDACFSIPFSVVNYTCSILRRVTHIHHHFDHIMAIFWGGHYGYFLKIDHNGPPKMAIIWPYVWSLWVPPQRKGKMQITYENEIEKYASYKKLWRKQNTVP